MTEYWIEGPPEKFEVGMMVADEMYDWGIVTEVDDAGNAYVFVGFNEDSAHWFDLRDVRGHCPMMPRKEAEDIERFAFEQGALAGYSRCQAGLETWVNNDEWECYLRNPLRRERRAGDE